MNSHQPTTAGQNRIIPDQPSARQPSIKSNRDLLIYIGWLRLFRAIQSQSDIRLARRAP